MSAEDAKIINQLITRYLSRREHSYFELCQKLTQKGFALQSCEAQITLFTERNIQSDSRYAESMIRNAFHSGKGPQVIRQKLLQHNIDGADIEQFIYSDDFDWFASARKVREKKFGIDLPVDFELKQKQMRFLQYRGFEQAHINEALT